MRRVLLVLCVLLVCAPACVADLYWQSTFNSDPVGATTPALWTWVNAPAPSIVDATTEGVTFGSPDEIVRCVRFNEGWGTPPVVTTSTAPRATIYRGFPWQIAGATASGGTGGTVVLDFDVRFGVENNEGFMVRLCGHDITSSLVTNGRTWGVGLLFAGSASYDAAGSAYGLQIQTKRFTQVYEQLRDSSSNAITYGPGIWYSVKIEADMVNQTCRFWFAPKGGTLVNVTSTPTNPDGWRGWMPSLGGSGVPAGTIVGNLHNAVFSLSRQNATEGIQGQVYLDNVKLTTPQDPIGSSVSDMRLAGQGAYVKVSEAIVTAGPGLVGTKVYIQDNNPGGAGVRVLPVDNVLALGDKVTVKGIIQQSSDSGTATVHNGEREIAATMITVNSSNNTLPGAVAMSNKNVGGGWLGADEAVSPVPEPRLKGVWPQNTFGDSDYSVGTNSFAPLFNVGTLVRVAGEVTLIVNYAVDDSYDIYISDGSLSDDGWRDSRYPITDDFHPAGIRIRMTKAMYDAITALYGSGAITGVYVTVTGISSATSGTDLASGAATGRNIRGIRLRSIADIQLVL